MHLQEPEDCRGSRGWSFSLTGRRYLPGWNGVKPRSYINIIRVFGLMMDDEEKSIKEGLSSAGCVPPFLGWLLKTSLSCSAIIIKYLI
jgi:hypothetical protein